MSSIPHGVSLTGAAGFYDLYRVPSNSAVLTLFLKCALFYMQDEGGTQILYGGQLGRKEELFADLSQTKAVIPVCSRGR